MKEIKKIENRWEVVTVENLPDERIYEFPSVEHAQNWLIRVGQDKHTLEMLFFDKADQFSIANAKIGTKINTDTWTLISEEVEEAENLPWDDEDKSLFPSGAMVKTGKVEEVFTILHNGDFFVGNMKDEKFALKELIRFANEIEE